MPKFSCKIENGDRRGRVKAIWRNKPHSKGSLLPFPTERVRENPGNEVGSDVQKWYCCVFVQAYNSETKEFEEAPVEARNAAMKGKVGKLIIAQKWPIV